MSAPKQVDQNIKAATAAERREKMFSLARSSSRCLGCRADGAKNAYRFKEKDSCTVAAAKYAAAATTVIAAAVYCVSVVRRPN